MVNAVSPLTVCSSIHCRWSRTTVCAGDIRINEQTDGRADKQKDFTSYIPLPRLCGGGLTRAHSITVKYASHSIKIRPCIPRAAPPVAKFLQCPTTCQHPAASQIWAFNLDWFRRSQKGFKTGGPHPRLGVSLSGWKRYLWISVA